MAALIDTLNKSWKKSDETVYTAVNVTHSPAKTGSESTPTTPRAKPWSPAPRVLKRTSWLTLLGDLLLVLLPIPFIGMRTPSISPLTKLIGLRSTCHRGVETRRPAYFK